MVGEVWIVAKVPMADSAAAHTAHVADRTLPDFGEVIAAARVYAKASGHPPVFLSGWDVEDPAIKPPLSLVRRLREIRPRLRGYAYPKDFARAKQRAAEALSHGIRMQGAPPTANHVAFVQNGTQGLLLALAALKARGIEEVVVAAPAYFTAAEVCRHLDLALRITPARDFFTGTPDVDGILRAMAGRPCALLLTNPAYSLGVEYRWNQLNSLFDVLPRDAHVLLDETRLGLSWRYGTPWYAADYPANVLVLRSPSKVFFLNGLKSALLLGAPELIAQVERLGEALVGSCTGDAEEVALAYLDCWAVWLAEVESAQPGTLRGWRERVLARLRRNLRAWRAALAPQGFTLSLVDSGPYVLAGIEQDRAPALDSVALAREAGIVAMTSGYFLHASEGYCGFRIHLCADASHAYEALHRMLLWAGARHERL
jgi:histidinol-phosphate/aromatic aminotransferase/cobyric acid decarboxylase-like protein